MQTFWEGRRRAPVRRLWRRPDPAGLADWAQSAKTALAGVLAWVVATDVLGLEQPFLAPWAAVLVVHATVFRTVSRGGQQIVATFLGVFLAWAAGSLFGIGPLGMGVMLATSFLVGRQRWLTEEATTIATTGIVVLSTNAIDQSNLLASRLLDTTVGVVVGLVVNLLVWPPLRDRAAWAHVTQLPQALAGVLSEMASGLGADLESSGVEGWIRRCRELDVRVDEAWRLLRQARESSRLNPRRSHPADLDDMERSLHLLEQAGADALSLARTVATSADNATVWEDSFRSQWKRLLSATATGLDERDVPALEEVRSEVGRLARDLSTDRLADSAWQEYGGLLMNLRNIVDAGVEVVRWTSQTGGAPVRRRRYEVPLRRRKQRPSPR
jgi:uncharacterized membrane protein YgaE (UPF0421/DUF939 family)